MLETDDLLEESDDTFAKLDLANLLLTTIKMSGSIFNAGAEYCELTHCLNNFEFHLSCGHKFCYECLVGLVVHGKATTFITLVNEDEEVTDSYICCPMCRGIITNIIAA